VVPPGADCICAGYLYRTFRVGKEVAEGGEPLAYINSLINRIRID
jgi:hypothetical protein